MAKAKPKTKPKQQNKKKTAAKRSAPKPAAVAASPARADIGKRRATKASADEVRLPLTAPVRLTPARRPMSFQRELPLFRGKE